jgi:hypothetical protein
LSAIGIGGIVVAAQPGDGCMPSGEVANFLRHWRFGRLSVLGPGGTMGGLQLTAESHKVVEHCHDVCDAAQRRQPIRC